MFLLISVFCVHIFILYWRKTGKSPASEMETESKSRKTMQLYIQIWVLKKVVSLPCGLYFKYLERLWSSMSTRNSGSTQWVLKRLRTRGIVWGQSPGLRPSQGNLAVRWTDLTRTDLTRSCFKYSPSGSGRGRKRHTDAGTSLPRTVLLINEKLSTIKKYI